MKIKIVIVGAGAAILAATTVSSDAETYRLKAAFDCWQVSPKVDAGTPLWLTSPDKDTTVNFTASGIHIKQTVQGFGPVNAFGDNGDWACRMGGGRIQIVKPDTFANSYEKVE